MGGGCRARRCGGWDLRGGSGRCRCLRYGRGDGRCRCLRHGSGRLPGAAGCRAGGVAIRWAASAAGGGAHAAGCRGNRCAAGDAETGVWSERRPAVGAEHGSSARRRYINFSSVARTCGAHMRDAGVLSPLEAHEDEVAHLAAEIDVSTLDTQRFERLGNQWVVRAARYQADCVGVDGFDRPRASRFVLV